ncbi:MAG: hypothetical protein EON59_10615 [Alphaproteobacteria bacterium]|nr:MAG: hypothetical protein EON59_10615 [Alphaproteobacteria bacterium]
MRPSDLEIASAIAGVFRSVEMLHSAGWRDGRGAKIRREAVHFLWETRDVPKLSPHRPHSIRAREYRRSGDVGDLRYEHSIPLATYMPILRAASADPHQMLSALKLYVRPVIVLEEECRLLSRAGLNSLLPAGSEPHDALARYASVGILTEAF